MLSGRCYMLLLHKVYGDPIMRASWEVGHDTIGLLKSTDVAFSIPRSEWLAQISHPGTTAESKHESAIDLIDHKVTTRQT